MASSFAAARGIGLNSRFSPQSFLAFATGRFGGSEFWRGVDFVVQQKMLPCATNDAVLRNKGMGGCAMRLAGVISSWEKGSYLYGEKCPQIITNLHKGSVRMHADLWIKDFKKVNILVQVEQRKCFIFDAAL